MRALAREIGADQPLMGAGVGSREPIAEGHWAADLFDFTAIYMDVPPDELRDEDYPFSRLADFTHEGRMAHAQDAVPYMPYVPAGWNPSPWGEMLRQVEFDLNQHTTFGLPGAKAFSIYAWNEYGEGGFVAPTRGEGYMKLREIRRVFGRPRE